MEIFEKINIELLKSDLSSIANEYKSGQIALDYIVQLEAKLAETTKIGEELIDERDDIIASFKADNAALKTKCVKYRNWFADEQGKNIALQRQTEKLREAWVWDQLKFKRAGNQKSAEVHIDSCLLALELLALEGGDDAT